MKRRQVAQMRAAQGGARYACMHCEFFFCAYVLVVYLVPGPSACPYLCAALRASQRSSPPTVLHQHRPGMAKPDGGGARKRPAAAQGSPAKKQKTAGGGSRPVHAKGGKGKPQAVPERLNR